MEIWLRNLTRREFRQRMDSGGLEACILPLGATEQHLEHLAMEHDWRSAITIAAAVASRLSPRVLVAEGVMAGVSEHHMKHPGTLSLSPGTFLNVLTDLLDSLSRAGFQHILVLNGHGGNINVCQAAWEQLRRYHPVNLQFLSYWETLTAEDARELLRSGHRLPEDLPGHAQEFETAIALAVFPENVRADALADQPDQTPAQATRETGGQLFERIVQRTTSFLGEMMEGTRVTPAPSYYP